ncbi:hypothetical protein CRENBAI_006343 [Crenichthys baileyi]|uniref:Uncharacterized protein n=1 Tax=Crenichthys baileyi TaxID=28760 RepID=A0AAV9SN06_9TELE
MQTSRQHGDHLLQDLLKDLPLKRTLSGSNPLLQKPHSCQLPQPATIKLPPLASPQTKICPSSNKHP